MEEIFLRKDFWMKDQEVKTSCDGIFSSRACFMKDFIIKKYLVFLREFSNEIK